MLDNIKNAPSLNGFNVLLVDDVNINLVLGKRLLTKLGVNVDIADSGAQCLEKMNLNDYHLILLDIQMEPMTGLETMARIRKQARWNQVSIVAVSSSLTEEVISQCRAFSVEQFLKRPFLKADLEAVLSSVAKKG
ncbi:CheY-like receiver domain-containing protein [Shewanella psychrophila]|uniref:CheY-like receiver domain-containing protein n=1 Tax=Shewanella psychrophila TaxID=225848 RepID=A0A1S6HU20_9GAMM|nr:response regulator [Shewanella psychrophila]AQS39043.1 CheY-like receiver domain-containing protein [Shewanella psychrophila]